ncbi:ATP-binding protein [Streptomyces sp. NPDC058268]|uniref:ATP-binding protein n=1 Tax=Streptomyces sp. NPDC058268 TaxID=3346413 RepID=UPI0036ECC537
MTRAPGSSQTDRPPGFNLTMANAPETVAEARRLVRTAYEAWGVEDYTDTAQLVISELVTNAVRHSPGPCIRVIVQHPLPGHLLLAVVDKSRTLPFMQNPHTDELSGRGLLLVDALADNWGITRLPWGKRVWAHIHAKTGQQQ